MKLMDVYLKMSGDAEKTAAAGSSVDALIASLGLTSEVKTAEDRGIIEKAAAYIEMGTQIARETFVSEVLGEPADKVAAATAKEEPKKEPAAAEKTATGVSTEKLMQDLGLVEKAAAAPADAEKVAAELKEGALRELVACHLVPAASSGSEKAMGALKKIASSEKGKEIITDAVKNAASAQEKSKGKLAEYLKSKGEKK